MNQPVNKRTDYIYKDLKDYYTQYVVKETSSKISYHNGRHLENRTLNINNESLSLYLDEAFEQKQLLLTPDSFYIQDISHINESEYNTVVYQISGSILKTHETTSQVMKRYFHYLEVDYSFVQRIGKCIGINQRCPYVVGETLFAPERGSTKNNSSWIAFHNIVYVEALDNQLINFKVRDFHDLTLPLSKKRTADMIQKSTSLYHTTKAISIDFQDKFSSRYQEHAFEDMHIIKKELANKMLGQPTVSLTDLIDYLSLHRANDMLQAVLGEENPYLDEIKAAFPLSLSYKDEYT